MAGNVVASASAAVTSLDEDLEDIFGASSDEEEFLGFPESESSDSESDDEALPATWQTSFPQSDATSNAWLPVLERTPGSNLADVDPDKIKAIDTFEALFDGPIVQNLVTETNRYAHQRIRKLGDRHPNSRLRQWRDTSKEEMLVSVLLVLAMGTVQQPEVRAHWSDHWLFATPGFTKVMARNRFQLQVACLHFSRQRRRRST